MHLFSYIFYDLFIHFPFMYASSLTLLYVFYFLPLHFSYQSTIITSLNFIKNQIKTKDITWIFM